MLKKKNINSNNNNNNNNKNNNNNNNNNDNNKDEKNQFSTKLEIESKQITISKFEWVTNYPPYPVPPFGLTIHPMAIIVGWIKSNPKHLNKYSKLYLDNGFVTISFSPSYLCHFFPKKMKELAYNFLEFLVSENEKIARPIIFQVFSGNMVFQSEIFKLLNEEIKFKKLIPFIKGQIFDSCPSKISEEQAFQSITKTMNRSISKKAVRLVTKSYSRLVDVEKIDKDFWDRLKKCPIPTPQLYIYSINDPISSYLDVERGIQIQKQQGIPVKTLCFDNSIHVNHLSQHPMRYMKNLYQFWEKTLRQPTIFNNIKNNNNNKYNLNNNNNVKSFVGKFVSKL
ncbi:hypothetical protein ACTFIW_012042 [Dictyostelium discoideum]